MKLRVFFSFILSSILFTISCSKVNKNHKDHIFDDGVAQWIQDRKKLPININKPPSEPNLFVSIKN